MCEFHSSGIIGNLLGRQKWRQAEDRTEECLMTKEVISNFKLMFEFTADRRNLSCISVSPNQIAVFRCHVRSKYLFSFRNNQSAKRKEGSLPGLLIVYYLDYFPEIKGCKISRLLEASSN
jgi:hypothetical protein